MTLQYVKQLQLYLEKANGLRKNPTVTTVCNLDKELRAFLGNDYIPFQLSSLHAKIYGTSRSIAEMQADVDTMIAALNSKLFEIPKSAEISNIISDIKLIEAMLPCGEDDRFQCVSRIYHSYCSVINFDDGIKNASRYADGSGLSAGEYSEATPSMLKGMQLQLERYAEVLCENKPTTYSAVPLIQVTNSPSVAATATANVTVDISVEIENAIKRVEDACLPDAQEKEVLAKIQELKDIMESKESKGKRWAKIKDFFKWVAEQGIQVASIIVPLLANTVK